MGFHIENTCTVRLVQCECYSNFPVDDDIYTLFILNNESSCLISSSKPIYAQSLRVLY